MICVTGFRRKLYSLFHEKRGFSMINVMVAFVVMLLLVSMFTGVVLISQNMMKKADSIRGQTERMMQDYYTGNTVQNIFSDSSKIELVYGDKRILLDTKIYVQIPQSLENSRLVLYSFGEHKAIMGVKSDGGET